MRSLVLLLHQALLGASATGPNLFFSPFFRASLSIRSSARTSHLPFSTTIPTFARNLCGSAISVSSYSLFWSPQSLPSLHAELRLPLEWISLYRLKKSSRHKVRTWHFTHAYRLPPIESLCPPSPARSA